MDAKKQVVEQLSKKFIELDEEGKAFIAGYITGKQEERQRLAKEREAPVA